jgi:ribosomal protein L12E/L44/L45/RPP1/RPP2
LRLFSWATEAAAAAGVDLDVVLNDASGRCVAMAAANCAAAAAGAPPDPADVAADARDDGGGLHSSTFQLNLSAFFGIGV